MKSGLLKQRNYKIIILIIAILILIPTFAKGVYDTKPIRDVFKNNGLDTSKSIIGFFTSPGNCNTCNVQKYMLLECLENKLDTIDYQVIVFVNCRRQKELNYFKKKNKIKFEAVMDKENLSGLLSENKSCDFIIFDYCGSVKYKKFNPIEADCNDIYKVLSKSN